MAHPSVPPWTRAWRRRRPSVRLNKPPMVFDSQAAQLATDEPEFGPDAYEDLLRGYIATRSEDALYRVSQLSQHLIRGGLGPEDIIALHFESFDRALAGQSARERAHLEGCGQQFLLEVMIAYGVQFQEHLELRLAQSQRDAQLRLEAEHQAVLDAERLRTVSAQAAGWATDCRARLGGSRFDQGPSDRNPVRCHRSR